MKKLTAQLKTSTYLNSVLIDIISKIGKASIDIANILSKGSIDKINLEKNGTLNSHGEEVTSLDLYANNLIFEHLQNCKKIKSIISEENYHEVFMHEKGRYKIAIDPLDGSSNIAMNIPVGTIFAIFDTVNSKIKGKDIIASGYIVYGTSLIMVVSDGFIAHEFTFCQQEQGFVISESNIKIPSEGNTYSINDAIVNGCEKGIQHYIEKLRNNTHSTARYVGSMVSDFHRNLKTGGIFMYPSTSKNPEGKLRLLYEVMPLAFIIEGCGGKSSTGSQNPLELAVTDIHQRSPILIGSSNMVAEVENEISRSKEKLRTA